ncbi:MAG: hypothetical protein AUK47_23160 [Deltaproteobacteria bacterium CG2_30_63_29]|nr:MAG: hypothetical protein AUK47_23160 [Deltaproteobacteria bacterium CG2_30_63_29]PIW00269.1 MAG: hypothetical protein COW42_08330 [Deltaproteobacteria bacterium CG17_big_fil_post_rev_8_21_14_2_50_63_7]PJB39505.1 MAG: hypothetical protein CO108_17120 [Deltaproteobacteria bacterium CG_4_9_14_3_um_filter_63_12]
MRILLLGVIAFILCFASVAHAQWDNTLSYEPANSASLKVVGTEGLRIDIDVDGVSKTDNVPAIFNLENLNAFVT